jgi:non-ribosomal peptide synthetase component E (peptide arylation enzyme)
VIIRGGVKISPARSGRSFSNIRCGGADVPVVGMPDDWLGESVCALVLPG